MPRDAPVTSATFAGEIEHAGPATRSLEIVGRSEVSVTVASRWIFRTSPLEHRARAHLNIRGDAFRRKAAHDRLPPHRRRHLRTSASIADARVALRLGIDVGHDRHARVVASSSARSSGASRSSAGFISAQWNGALTASGIDALGAERLGPLAGARCTAAACAGDHDLAGAVHVRRADDLALAPPPRTPARPCRRRAPRIAAIAPVADRHRLLHVAAAAPHDPHRVGERERARRRRWRSTRRGCGRRRTPARCRATRARGRRRC